SARSEALGLTRSSAMAVWVVSRLEFTLLKDVLELDATEEREGADAIVGGDEAARLDGLPDPEPPPPQPATQAVNRKIQSSEPQSLSILEILRCNKGNMRCSGLWLLCVACVIGYR